MPGMPIARIANPNKVCFFFSSRRRHTRLSGDWSSDVCSSDLRVAGVLRKNPAARPESVDHGYQAADKRQDQRWVARHVFLLLSVFAKVGRHANGAPLRCFLDPSSTSEHAAETIGQPRNYKTSGCRAGDKSQGAGLAPIQSAFNPGAAAVGLQPQEHDMSLHKVSAGENAPESFNVIIEIPMNADPIKYEVDKASGAIFVDRFMSTSMNYPTNYGYVPRTLSGDGDPVDVLVITPVPLIPGVVVTCRPLGILKMQDEAGEDGKVLAVPTDKILSIYTQWRSHADLNPARLHTIAHFFEHYKDLEPGKWVKILGWAGVDAAKKEIVDGKIGRASCRERV